MSEGAPAADTTSTLPTLSPPVSASPPASVFPTVGPALFDAVRAGQHRKILLQVPAGLIRNAHDLAGRLRDATGVPVVLAARACFGACDFPTTDEGRDADAAVVLGHSPIPNVRRNRTMYFVEMREAGGDAPELARIVHDAGLPNRLGLVSSIQHLDLIPALTRELGALGHALVVGTGDHRLAYPAQALGCNYTGAESIADDVEAFLFLGTGRFHPLGLAFAVAKPVWSLDPLQGTLEPPIDREALIARRQLRVAGCRDLQKFGILVSSFPGQDRSPTALALQRRARAHGREAEILVFDRLDPRDLMGRALDAYVNTACPRIALDDADLYDRPMLTPPEFLMALGELPMAPYRFDTYH